MNDFSKDFLWGAASAAAQCEGAWDIDGRTPSIWDMAPSKKIKNGDNCRVSCDHYHHMKEDVALMKKIGLNSYRFSISWSRVIPEEGKVNPLGIKFYSDLVDELKANDIEPIVTIYHWDMPVWVNKKGGWMSDAIIPLFRDYTKVVVDALSDRVQWWIAVNEPSCFIMNGYMQGAHAPFKHNYLALNKLTRVLMIAHAEAVKTIRQYAKLTPKVGLSFATSAYTPKAETVEEIEYARKQTIEEGPGLLSNRWWMDPILAGKPVQAYGIYHINKKDMPLIRFCRSKCIQ
jgi:beta-glucosidase